MYKTINERVENLVSNNSRWGRWLRSAEVYNKTKHSGEKSDKVQIPVLPKQLIPLVQLIDQAEFLQIIKAEEEGELDQSESYRYPRVGTSIRG